ncbi:MAG: Peptidyl-tRNA hydrolase, partial [uncultured Gemmatimonadetes bacterium]
AGAPQGAAGGRCRTGGGGGGRGQGDRGAGKPRPRIRQHPPQRGMVASGRPGPALGRPEVPRGKEPGHRHLPGRAVPGAADQAADLHEPQRLGARSAQADGRAGPVEGPAGAGGRRGAGARPRAVSPLGKRRRPQRAQVHRAGAGHQGLPPPAHWRGGQAPRRRPGRLGALAHAAGRPQAGGRAPPGACRGRGNVDARRRRGRDGPLQPL